MAQGQESRRSYPWGTRSPSVHLKSTSRRVRGALDKALEPRFSVASDRAAGVVRTARPLVEALEYLSKSGLRPTAHPDPLLADDVAAGVRVAREAIGQLASSSILTVSESYRGFAASMEVLLELADAAMTRGISESGDQQAANLWQEFDP